VAFGVVARADTRTQDELDPATGRVRWRVVSRIPAIAIQAGIVTALGPDQITMRDTLTGQTRWAARIPGELLPLVASPWPASPVLPVFPAGPFLVVSATSPDGSDLLAALRMSDGHRRWQITIPGRLAAPLSAVSGGMLVYTVTPQRIFAP
jgi:hypothetical protein